MTTIIRKPERGIVATACQIDGLTFSMPAPARHHDVLDAMLGVGVGPSRATQGFIDHRGLFVGRKQAMIVAHRFGQIQDDEFADGCELFSEHLW